VISGVLYDRVPVRVHCLWAEAAAFRRASFVWLAPSR
jgi:hypothetical protein